MWKKDERRKLKTILLNRRSEKMQWIKKEEARRRMWRSKLKEAN